MSLKSKVSLNQGSQIQSRFQFTPAKSKKRRRQKNMATFGIFSRVELKEDDIRDALGSNIDETRLIENQQLEDKVKSGN
jgi:hypothetical protein